MFLLRGTWVIDNLRELTGDKEMEDAYCKLVYELPQLFNDHSNPRRPKLVIAIDEAQTLNNVVGRRYRPSDALCKVTSAFSRTFSEVSNWVVFVSTSRVADPPVPSTKVCE